MKRIALFLAILFTAVVSLVMTEGRMYAIKTYGAPCIGEAYGFEGFLQATNFLPVATCPKSDDGSGCKDENSECTIKAPVSGVNLKGKCKTVSNIINPCKCQPN